MPELILIFTVGLATLWVIPAVWFGHNNFEAIHLEEAFLIPMFMMLSSINIIFCIIMAQIITSLFLKRPWYKFLFNTAQLSLAAYIGSLFGTSLTGAAIGALSFSVLTAFFVWSLFKFVLKTHWEDNIAFRFIVIGTSLLSGVFMASRIDLLPIASSIAIGSQLYYSHLYQTKEPVPVLVAVI